MWGSTKGPAKVDDSWPLFVFEKKETAHFNKLGLLQLRHKTII